MTAQILDLKPNVKQVFFGQNNVYVQTPSSFIQPGIISGTYGNDKTLQKHEKRGKEAKSMTREITT